MKYIYKSLLLLAIFIIASCNSFNSESQLNYVQIDSVPRALNMNSQFYQHYESDSPYIAPIVPVYDEDYISFGNNGYFKFKGGKDIRLQYAFIDSFEYINGKINSIELNSKGIVNADQNKFLKLPLQELNSITIESEMYDTLPEQLLKEISKSNPKAGITFYYDSADNRTTSNFIWLLTQFKPINLSTFYSDTIFQCLKLADETELLNLRLDSKVINKSLPKLKLLKQLFLYNEYIDSALSSLPDNFLIDNDQIEQLTITAYTNKDLKIISPLKKLKTLHLILNSNFKNLHDLSHLKNLKRLIIEGYYVKDLDDIKKLKKLTWLRLPDSISHKDLQDVINNLPALEVLELTANSDINNFSFLKANKKLKAFTIYSDKKIEIKGLDQLQQLEFLSLPKKNLKDSLLFSHLKKSLPNTKLVPNSGVCLSSVWLLLIIPLVIIIQLIRKRFYQN